MAAVCPKDQKKTEPDHEKNLFIAVSDQVVLKLKHAQFNIQNPTRVLNSIQGICV